MEKIIQIQSIDELITKMELGHTWYYSLQLDTNITDDDHFDDINDF